MRLLTLIAIVLTTCSASLAAELKREKWHVPEREYQAYDSVMIPLVDFATIRKVHIGMQLERVKKLTGFLPIEYYIHPAYSILLTELDGVRYEVAFWHGKSAKVLGISFRKAAAEKTGEPNGGSGGSG